MAGTSTDSGPVISHSRISITDSSSAGCAAAGSAIKTRTRTERNKRCTSDILKKMIEAPTWLNAFIRTGGGEVTARRPSLPEHNAVHIEKRAHYVGDAAPCNRNGMMEDATKLEQVITNCSSHLERRTWRETT